MTQTVPATAVLGPGKTGLPIGLRVLDIDRVQYSAFSTTGVAETGTAGTYSKAGGAVVPDAGGYIVWGVSGTDYAEATVDSTSANVTYSAGVALAGRLAEVTDLPAASPSASVIADAVLDEVVEGTLTLRKIMRLTLAKLANKASGGSTTTIRYRSLADDKDRIVETVDPDGNRSAVTLDGD